MTTMMRSNSAPPDDPAIMAGQVLLRLGIAIFAIGVPCGAVVSRRLLFVLMPVAAVLMIAGSLLLPGTRQQLKRHLRIAFIMPLVMIPLFLIIWAGLSFIWTPYAGLAGERFLKSAGTILVATAAIACLPARIRASNSNLLAIGVAAAALAAVMVSIISPATTQDFDADGSTLQRAIVGLVVLVWPALAALALRERVAAAGIIGVGVAGAAILVWMPYALAALLIGILVFSLSYARPERAGQILGAIGAGLMLAGPVIPLLLDPLAARLDQAGPFGIIHIWAQIIHAEGLKLVTGHGFDTAARALSAGLIPLRSPRGILFEIWYELGIIGAAAVAAVFWHAFLEAGRVGRAVAPFLLAALASVLTISITGVSVAQLWWTTLLGAVALAFAVVLRAQTRSDRVQAGVLKERPTVKI